MLFRNLLLRRVFGLLLLLVAFFHTVKSHAQNIPLDNAFAHNDYQHKRPLFEAINNGYTYIEVDVYIHKNRLVVTHVLPAIHHHRTLEGLYLQPLADYVQKNNGEVYPGYTAPVTLMIDIKSDPDKTYQLLKPLLEKYRTLLCGYQNGLVQTGAVRIVLSGHKPYTMLRDDQNRLAFLDEDLRKINRDTTTDDMLAMASCKYSKLLKWKGTGLFSLRERARLSAYVDQAHRCGAKVRLWSSPDNQAVWKQLLQCGVDLINTDKLARLKDFLKSDNANTPKVN
jgi:glycerophosphoryl diester phosphodiesterase